MITAYIGVGSNLERKKHIEAAIVELSQIGEELRISTIYECDAIGFQGEAFYNLVVEMKTTLDLTEFSRALRTIELKWGRKEDAAKFEPRTLDLDIILFGEQISAAAPMLPRADIYQYAFVIQPLNELCPDLIVPNDGRTIAQIYQQSCHNERLIEVVRWF
ncbi:2-amino-4-hydroxy-6-hydroxymethyldihydropteridine diphosphokinase [Vibrio ponticus]|uniref:2-amino-4-hydroxy-6-hydroxymethyldihydropteridine diphosphokinase n=1 Tax=Vibrio ponticus TaxID=265668 RepID=A0A3N3DZ86_9VIBR|nr:2-amino-4-hydroxy-6-hydroxymethyldihydropteridine diphosphokinase [Vibrio ponticus]OLQ91335.1 2-amino-4-hydroxy-6-hydroxymethyldihydropteridine diphosphokinase [Vibrio ponticus]ROV59709.1 2-amino-4-hydroxy-6-hydroxymethyldihydropteridine diphosphokinase [Vibrio ponticus]